jgi:hypothetical protein
MTDTWQKIHDAALTVHKDGGRELARLVIEADDVVEELTVRIEELEAKLAKTGEALLDSAAHLCSATSLLERGGKKAAPSDKIFKQILKNYNRNLKRTRATLAELTGGKDE